MHKEFLKKLIETVCRNNLVWPKNIKDWNVPNLDIKI